uniref:Uncharacterized protein n=1 Tax=Romanomermis culicivorax TaxID=13658 RepID=A0A915I018_ROMCU
MFSGWGKFDKRVEASKSVENYGILESLLNYRDRVTSPEKTRLGLRPSNCSRKATARFEKSGTKVKLTVRSQLASGEKI